MKFIRMLQWAHGVEIGASLAYRGHAANVKNSFENTMIRLILSDEAWHRIDLQHMLDELNAKPNKLFDALFWCIGKTISAGCYVMGYRMAMWGAKIMEMMGSQIYWKLAEEATNSGHQKFHAKLCNMARQEEKHEEFFKNVLDPPCTCRHLAYLSGSVAREVNPDCEANHENL